MTLPLPSMLLTTVKTGDHDFESRLQVFQMQICVLLRLNVQVVDTLCSVAALNLVRAHPMSRAAYNLLITYLITELHSGEFRCATESFGTVCLCPC